MKCSLWLNRKKIDSAVLIPDNLDIASLRGYFLGGSLIEWLEEHDGAEYARRLIDVSPDDLRLNEKISEIFGGSVISGKPLDGGAQSAESVCKCEKNRKNAQCSFFAGSGGVVCSISGSLAENSFAKWGSFDISAAFGSYLSSSFSEWEWEWLWNYFRGFSSGSFAVGSFLYNSFYYWQKLESYFGGSFAIGSFKSFGSFSGFSQWERLSDLIKRLAGSKCGSFSEDNFMGLDEYDFIMLKTLLQCPLDRFGYGVHIV